MILDQLLALRRRRAPAPLRAGLILCAALSVACSSSTTPPPADPTGSTPMFGPNDMPPGTRVQINRGGQWYPGTIVQPLGSDRFVVSYDGAGPEWNEAVGMDRIRTQAGGGSPTAAQDYRVGEKVLVTSQNRVLLADVVGQLGATAWRVHYDGYGPEAVEYVGAERLRRPYVGLSAHAVGEAVTVDVNGQPLPARIVALSGSDRWIVRYDGYAPQYDQEIGPDRLRAQAPPPAPVAIGPSVPPAPAEPPAKPDKAGKKGGKAEPPAAAPLLNAPLQVGDAVVVSQRGALFPATIVAIGSAGQWRVRFDGAFSGDEDVAADRVQRLHPPVKGAALAQNQLVLIEWHGLYVPGKILKEQDRGQYKVRYDGLGAESDDIVPQKRLRPR
jgi:Agenet domain